MYKQHKYVYVLKTLRKYDKLVSPKQSRFTHFHNIQYTAATGLFFSFSDNTRMRKEVHAIRCIRITCILHVQSSHNVLHPFYCYCYCYCYYYYYYFFFSIHTAAHQGKRRRKKRRGYKIRFFPSLMYPTKIRYI